MMMVLQNITVPWKKKACLILLNNFHKVGLAPRYYETVTQRHWYLQLILLLAHPALFIFGWLSKGMPSTSHPSRLGQRCLYVRIRC